MRRRLKCLAAIGIAIVVAASPALADAIDGDWCNGSATMHVEFPSTIRIPSGRDVTGTCGRHACQFTTPAGETNGGTDVLMKLVNEQTMELWRFPTTPTPETWTRCQPVS